MFMLESKIRDVALFVDIRPSVADWQRAAGAAISNWALIRKDSVFEGTAGQPPRADVMLLGPARRPNRKRISDCAMRNHSGIDIYL